MANGEKLTEDQHFVPQMYLRGFAEIVGSKKDKAFVWEYDLKMMRQIPKQVNVKTVCFEKNLYEFWSESGEIVAQNRIENAYGNIEKEANNVIRSIKAKAQNKNCLNCQSVLSEYEKSILTIFQTVLQFRDPQTIDSGVDFLLRLHTEMSTRDARNLTLMNLLPLGIDPDWDRNTISRTALERYCKMAFRIGYTSDDVIITSDRPVIEWPPDKNEKDNRPQAVAFPLTSRLVLFMYSQEPAGNSTFFELNEEHIRNIQHNVSLLAREKIFSRYPLNEEQIEIAKEARRKKHENCY